MTEPPLATEPFHDALVTVTFFPDCVQFPFQPLCNVWLPAYEYVSVQLLQAGPLLVIMTCAPNPEPQSLLTE